MSDPNSAPEHVTVIKEGSSGSILVGVIIAIALAFAAWYLLSGGKTVDPTDAKIGAAADKVGEAADKVEDAVDQQKK